jgi:excisionase family DNA binding protein
MTLLTVEEAAERLGTKPRFIRRLLAEDRIERYKIGRHVRIADTDLDAYIAAGRIEPDWDGPSAQGGRTEVGSKQKGRTGE